MEYWVRALKFVVRNLFGILLLAIVLLIGFRVGMDTTHAYIIVSDGMKERVAQIMLPAENQTDLTNYFTQEYLASDSLLTDRVYEQDRIVSYDYDLDIEPFYCVPGRNRVSMLAVLDVSDIRGTHDTGRTDENGKAITEGIKDWDRQKVEIFCVKESGRWLISDIKSREILEPKPTPTDEPVVTPRPTATPVPEPEYTGKPGAPAPTATTAPVIKLGEVHVKDTLNVRSGPSGSYEWMGTLKDGEEVEILREENGWYCIRWKEGEAYVSARYVRVPQ